MCFLRCKFRSSYQNLNCQRFYSERIVVSGQPYTVQVAAPMHEALEAIEDFGILLAFAIPVLLVGASAGGYWLSKRALDPVDGTKLWVSHQWGNNASPCVWTTRIVEYQITGSPAKK